MYNYGGMDQMRQYMSSNQYPQPTTMQQSNIRRSYEPQPAASAAGSKAGVGLLFQTGGDGKITVKEIVKGGSAWRSNLVKPGDVIVRVGNVNVQNQSLANLRELILGENGTFVTLGFSRGGTSDMYDARMMRGTPEFLDSIGATGASVGNLTSNMSEASHAPPPPTVGHTASLASNAPAPTLTQQINANEKLQQAASSSMSRERQSAVITERASVIQPPVTTDRIASSVNEKPASNWTSGSSNIVPPTLSASNSALSNREHEELERLRTALNASQRDVADLRTKLRTQELLQERNNEELRTYREALEKRDDEHRQGLHDDEAKRQQQFTEFKQRYDRERAKLVQAIEKSALVGSKLQAILPAVNGLSH